MSRVQWNIIRLPFQTSRFFSSRQLCIPEDHLWLTVFFCQWSMFPYFYCASSMPIAQAVLSNPICMELQFQDHVERVSWLWDISTIRSGFACMPVCSTWVASINFSLKGIVYQMQITRNACWFYVRKTLCGSTSRSSIIVWSSVITSSSFHELLLFVFVTKILRIGALERGSSQ
jgi:hypothetical protein